MYDYHQHTQKHTYRFNNNIVLNIYEKDNNIVDRLVSLPNNIDENAMIYDTSPGVLTVTIAKK